MNEMLGLINSSSSDEDDDWFYDSDDEDYDSLISNEDNAGAILVYNAYRDALAKDILNRLIPEGKRREATIVCMFHPNLAEWTDPEGGKTPLHLACERYEHWAPFSDELVKALLDAYPEAASQTDNDGNTPLHIASGKYIKDKTIQALLDVNPNAASIQNFEGELPLHRSKQLCVMKILMRYYPQGLTVRNHDGQTPLVTAVEKLRNGVLRDCIPDLVRAWTAHTMPLLHACLVCPICPLYKCASVAFAHPEQCSQRDKWGNYPLHLAARLMGTRIWTERVQTHRVLKLTSSRRGKRRYTDHVERVMEVLTKECPKAAQVKNMHGQIPFEIALATKTPWKAGIQCLLDCYPSGLFTKGRIGEVVRPNILARVGKDCKLSTMFEIVKGMPDLFQHAKPLRRSSRKRRLKVYDEHFGSEEMDTNIAWF